MWNGRAKKLIYDSIHDTNRRLDILESISTPVDKEINHKYNKQENDKYNNDEYNKLCNLDKKKYTILLKSNNIIKYYNNDELKIMGIEIEEIEDGFTEIKIPDSPQIEIRQENSSKKRNKTDITHTILWYRRESKDVSLIPIIIPIIIPVIIIQLIDAINTDDDDDDID